MKPRTLSPIVLCSTKKRENVSVILKSIKCLMKIIPQFDYDVYHCFVEVYEDRKPWMHCQKNALFLGVVAMNFQWMVGRQHIQQRYDIYHQEHYHDIRDIHDIYNRDQQNHLLSDAQNTIYDLSVVHVFYQVVDDLTCCHLHDIGMASVAYSMRKVIRYLIKYR